MLITSNAEEVARVEARKEAAQPTGSEASGGALMDRACSAVSYS
jgi:hypothetical protein